ncbi:MAG TPA: hypothetical protein H9736_09270 [Candidatus Anaerotruncus excrementipullorum]|uniref:Uncharacterized protein n=1 Tax=Candidatus Anaerotruncus excrementipullorum TaxID=2838465 RepID=A0A9D1WSN9_9FIRM|nr:hypothetical protein [Candidatus Anaerotruncus excrementipullorum]
MKQEKKTNMPAPGYVNQTQNSLENTTARPNSSTRSSRQKRTTSKTPTSGATDCGH